MPQTEYQPTNLRCEYFVNPLAIGSGQPRLSWWLNDPRPGAKQTAYQICVDGLWDSGKIDSDQSIQVAYSGPALRSRQRCVWKVRTWDATGQPSAWSEPAFWEMGLLARSDWKGEWIGSPIVGGPYTIPPAPHLRTDFQIDRPIASARLYVTALGLYEFAINGQRVGDNVFVPGRTEYTKRVPYHVYDVTTQLRQGQNACGAILGDGWYCGHLHSDPRQTFGDRPRLLAQLEIQFADGSAQTITTDSSWQAGEGPIRSSDMLMGEDYDARWESQRPFSSPSGRGQGEGELRSTSPGVRPHPNLLPEGEGTNAAWRPVEVFGDPGVEIVAHRAPPPRKVQELKPIAPPTVSANKRRHIFDLGQNMVGWIRLRIRNAPPGKTIDLRYTEMLDKDGKPYTTALRTARATDHYTTQGGDEEFFEPHFTFHGFRYVEVRDYPGRNPTIDDLVGIVVHSDTEPTGTFECSDPMINKLQSNIVWSQKGNFLDIPTDCPQRDERLGWTGDAQVFIKTAAFNMDVAGFFTKWIQDVADAQFPDGQIPSVVPHVTSIHHEGGPAWADACIICPWTVYLCYGDKRILEDGWPMMTRFMDWLQKSYPDHIRPRDTDKWKGYGDWLSIDAPTPPELIGTAFYAGCAHLMSAMAWFLGRSSESARYDQLFQQIRQAFQHRFVKISDVPFKKGDITDFSPPLTAQTQTACVLALHFDLLEDKHRAATVEALVRDIETRGMHLSTGFVGTPYLNHVLTRFGRSDVAYALLAQKTFPSWLYPITQGATTMWERWDAWTHEKGFGDAGMNSYNHYAYGAVGDWMYSAIAGINLDPLKPGYKHIIIWPVVGGGLTWARGSLKSPYGLIESAWRIDGEAIKLQVTIPPNTTATIHVPGGEVVERGAGRHEFKSPLSK